MSRLQTKMDLVQAGIALRAAIARGDLDDAQGLLPLYCRQVAECLNAVKGDDQGVDQYVARLAEETVRVFDWIRANVSTLRAQAALDLQRLRSGPSYLESSQPGKRTWALEG